MTAPTALEILERARTYPWTKGGSVAGESVCLVNAVKRAALRLWEEAGRGSVGHLRHQQREAMDFLLEALGPDVTSLPTWNDELERTEAEVRAVEDRAIELAREAERV